MRWTESVKKGALSTPAGAAARTANALCLEMNALTQLSGTDGAESGVYGCRCATARACARNRNCTYDTLRIDRQRNFTVGNVAFASFNVQKGDDSWAALSVQTGVDFGPNGQNHALGDAMAHSLANGVRVTLANDAGANAFREAKREMTPIA